MSCILQRRVRDQSPSLYKLPPFSPQVYAEMKMVSAVSGASGVLDVDSAVATALRPAPVDDSSPNSTTPPEKPSGSQHSTATEESGDTAAAESSGGAEAKARDTTFDPPGAAAKAGSKKQLPTGVGVFWPKMPCLRCGCPWWLGEDWDAKCAPLPHITQCMPATIPPVSIKAHF